MQPIGDFVLVRLDQPIQQTEGGLHLPDQQESIPVDRGTVVAVGEGHLTRDGGRSPLLVRVGDKALFGKQGLIEIARADGLAIVAMHERNIICVERE